MTSQLEMFGVPVSRQLTTSNACDIGPVGKRRDGGTRYWCFAHKADATAKYGKRGESCRAAHLPPITPEDVLSLNLSDFPGGIALWGAVPPVYDTTSLPLDFGVHVHARLKSADRKVIDQTFRQVKLVIPQLPTEGFHISENDAVYYMVSTVFGFQTRYVVCTYCGHPHLDKDWFSVHQHRRHLCAGCGKNFRDTAAGIGNPIRIAQETSGLLPRPPVKAARSISFRQKEFPGGIQIWGSNPALIWSSEKSEEEGIHIHAFKEASQMPDLDETYSAVEIDGISLDPTMVRVLMAQNSLPHLTNRIVPMKCVSCRNSEFCENEHAYTPVVGRTCSRCGGVLSAPTRLRKTIANPLIEILERLAQYAPRSPQKHSTGLLPETL